MSRRTIPVATDRREGIRGALLHTLPGRAIVIGVAVKLAVTAIGAVLGGVGPFLGVVDTVAVLAAATGVAVFGFRLIVEAKRRLLWRVRRKLIISYVFIGLFPAMLLVLFALLCGFLLFYHFSSYLVQSRLRALGEQARFVAQSTALEIQRAGGRDVASIVARRQASAAEQYPGVSIAVVPVSDGCGGSRPTGKVPIVNAGPWAHVAPPLGVPPWIDCRGFSGVFAYTRPAANASASASDTHLLVRGIGYPDSNPTGYAVVVDLLVNDSIRQQLRAETGVELKSVTDVSSSSRRADTDARPLAGSAPAAGREAAAPPAPGLLNSLPTLLEYRDWSTGAPGTLTVTTALKIGELYDRISAAEGTVGRTFAQGLLLVLFVIGALFLIIEVMSLIAGFALAKSLTGSVHELFTGTERVRQGDFTHKIAVKSDDQLGELAGSFNSMTASIEDLLRQAAEKKRLEEELRIAHEIQMSLLPQGPLQMSGLSVTALCVPAREVGGDYYDFLPLDDHRVGVLIADVSGKGTSAALYMAELKGVVLSLSETHSSPRELLVSVNRIIAQHLDARSFITMTYAVIDLRARTMTYARAGHTPLIYVPGSCGAPGPRQVN